MFMNETDDRPALTSCPPKRAVAGCPTDAREDRLAAALRANLRRRKAVPGRSRDPGVGA